jgi:hypothetical protein
MMRKPHKRRPQKYKEATVEMSALISEEELEHRAGRPAGSIRYLCDELPHVYWRLVKDGKVFFHRDDAPGLLRALISAPRLKWYKGPRRPDDTQTLF